MSGNTKQTPASSQLLIMPYTYGRRYRRRSRSARRFRRRTTYGRRFKRVRRYRRRSTASSVIKLTQDAAWTLNATGSPMHWNAFSFSPVSLPGFSDYQTTYSHFRILKAKLFISRTIGDNDGALYNYLVVGSRPFSYQFGRICQQRFAHAFTTRRCT